MLPYTVAASAYLFVQKRIDLLKAAGKLSHAVTIMFDETTSPTTPKNITNAALEDFMTARPRIQELSYQILLPSLQKGGYGYVALEHEDLRTVFEPLGQSANKQIQKIKRLARCIEEEMCEFFGELPNLSSEPSTSSAEVVGSEDSDIEEREDHVWDRRILKSEIKAWKRAEENIVEMYATPRCLEWALSFQQRALPREVRDLIYFHLINPMHLRHETHVRIGSKKKNRQSLGDQVVPRVQNDLRQHSWLLNPDAFGPEMALEIAKVYFQEMLFLLTNAELIPAFLTYSPFNLGLQLFDYIANLTILHWSDLTDLHAALMHLCTIKRKNKLKLDLRFYTPFYRPRDGKAWIGHEKTMLGFLEDLRYPIYELIHSGSEVAIWQVVFDHWGEQFQYGHRRLTSFCSDLPESSIRCKAPVVDFFTLTAYEWMDEKANGGNMDPAKHYPPDASESELSDALRLRWRQSGALEGFDIFSSTHNPDKTDGPYLVLSDMA